MRGDAARRGVPLAELAYFLKRLDRHFLSYESNFLDMCGCVSQKLPEGCSDT